MNQRVDYTYNKFEGIKKCIILLYGVTISSFYLPKMCDYDYSVQRFKLFYYITGENTLIINITTRMVIKCW